MRSFIGNLCILAFIFTFILLFLEAGEELQQTRTLQEVLDEAIEPKNISLAENSMILDANGKRIYDIYSDENRIYLEYDDIPKKVIDALVAAEDQSFFTHKGFDMSGIARAFLINMNSGSIQQGGSTITQQLIRNLYLTHEKTYERKVAELIYAYQFEQKLSKEKIIELYVNAIYFHNGVYGIEAASQYYFSKPAAELSIAEAAFLCAVPNNPQLYDPLKKLEQTNKRKEWILSKMLETNKITEAQYEDANAEAIILSIYEKADDYPDYITYVFHELEQLVGAKEGYTKQLKNASTAEEKAELKAKLEERVQALLKQGIIIETALDPAVQQQSVQSVNYYLNNTQLQGASVIIDHAANEIVALTGGKAYQKFDFNRAYQAYRQPGSSIKPLLVFAPYIEETYSAERTIIDASPFSKNGYAPKNYGGAVYGKVRMEEAFKHSYNTAAVRLLDKVGTDTAFSYFDAFDFQKIVADDHVLPAALGGLTNGVSVLEMTQAYSVFANNGNYYSPKAIRQVLTKDGTVLYSWNKKEKQLWSAETNAEMRKMLHRVVTEGTGRQAYFSTSGYIGGKTGTTNAYNDLWFVGLTDHYTAGVWIGIDEPQAISTSYQQLHLHIWRNMMNQIER
ncbi:penicillin-binding protein 1A [Evansella caseinilytica]|uniref:Penicillin-binding protein 1A n=1 Tax=Evansella caseinilytica TaxID=1503961 RepID=A0A1H3R0P1_9BACI|nr:transglycosylase domain-containing protein [Evansella caseinilytica]SDZ19384.1 penicillin-binding protein 1A [Evansella caseinilytica]